MKKISGFIIFLFMAIAAFSQDSTQYNGKAGVTDVALQVWPEAP